MAHRTPPRPYLWNSPCHNRCYTWPMRKDRLWQSAPIWKLIVTLTRRARAQDLKWKLTQEPPRKATLAPALKSHPWWILSQTSILRCVIPLKRKKSYIFKVLPKILKNRSQLPFTWSTPSSNYIRSTSSQARSISNGSVRRKGRPVM